MPAKVLVVGLDGMSPDLVLRGIRSGKLPNLAALQARGVTGRVLNPPRFFSGASWPCFCTGVSPARHGQYLRTEYDPRTLDYRPFRPESGGVAPFWRGPGWGKRRTAVVDLPYVGLDEGIDGLQIAEWGLHDLQVGVLRTWPPALAEDIVARFGKEPVGHCSEYRGRAGYIELRDRLLRRVRAKRDMVCSYLGADDWDLLVAVFDDVHCVSHRFWHLHDRMHVAHDPAVAAAVGDAIEDVYVEIDRALGAAVDLLDDASTVMFLSTHGMTSAFDANSVLDEILRRIEGLGPRTTQLEEARKKFLIKAKSISDGLPWGMRRALDPLRRRFGRGQIHDGLVEERRTRKCFWIPTHDTWGGIRINLVGRESVGRVHPGDEYERFVDGLIRDLGELRDGDSGEPIVGEVVRASDVYPREFEGAVPDLVVHWSKHSLKWIESPKVGRLRTRTIAGRTGDHDPSMVGIFFAAGASVSPGSLCDPVRLEDFAPTISNLVGASPGETEGAAIAGIGSPAMVRAAAR